jgi:surface antigen
LLTVAFLAAGTVPVYADPPPWAPAHGYRDNHPGKGKGNKHKYRSSYEQAYVVPFGIDMGQCNREEIGTLVGAAVGGYVGSRVADGDAKVVAIAGGAVIGAIVGGQIGRSMDKADHYCVGQALEYAEEGRPVSWTDSGSNARYRVTALETFKSGWEDQYCRRYRTTAVIDNREQTTTGTACRAPDGSWQMMN